MTTFKQEAREILKKRNKAMFNWELSKEILKRGNVKTSGLTPNSTLSSIIIRDIKKNGSKSTFIKTESGKFDLNKKLK